MLTCDELAHLVYTPSVSVGIPVLNGADTLARAIESVLTQTLTDFELVISDNASSDGTETIGRRFARIDSRVRVIRQPRTVGPTENFRAVLDAARAPYFMWLASDDYISPETLQQCAEILDTCPDVVCAMPLTEFVADDGTRRLALGDFTLSDDTVSNLCRFLVNPSDNSRFYGLYRRDALCRAMPTRTYNASDWMASAATLRYGKHVPAEGARLVRQDAKPAKYYRAVDRLATNWFDRRFPLAPFTRAMLRSREIPKHPRVLAALMRLNLQYNREYWDWRRHLMRRDCAT